MSRRRSGRRRGNNSSIVPKIGFGAVMLFVSAFVIYAWSSRAPAVDAQTGCPIENGASKRAISILLDTTEELTATQRELIRITVFQVVDSADTYDRISIFEVDPSRHELLQPIFLGCKPGTNDQAGPVVAKFRAGYFLQRLDEYFDSRQFDRPTSPIMAAIGSVAASYPPKSIDRSLIIVSDFIENSEYLNQYRSDWHRTYEGEKKRFLDSRPRLEGVKVSLLFIPRPDVKHQDKEFANWWIGYLRDAGANVTHQSFENSESGNQFYLDPFTPITG